MRFNARVAVAALAAAAAAAVILAPGIAEAGGLGGLGGAGQIGPRLVDTGLGLEEIRDRIFSIFVLLAGTGIGAYLCWQAFKMLRDGSDSTAQGIGQGLVGIILIVFALNFGGFLGNAGAAGASVEQLAVVSAGAAP